MGCIFSWFISHRIRKGWTRKPGHITKSCVFVSSSVFNMNILCYSRNSRANYYATWKFAINFKFRLGCFSATIVATTALIIFSAYLKKVLTFFFIFYIIFTMFLLSVFYANRIFCILKIYQIRQCKELTRIPNF